MDNTNQLDECPYRPYYPAMSKETVKKNARFEMRTDTEILGMVDELRLDRQRGADLPTRTELIHQLITEAFEKMAKKKNKSG